MKYCNNDAPATAPISSSDRETPFNAACVLRVTVVISQRAPTTTTSATTATVTYVGGLVKLHIRATELHSRWCYSDSSLQLTLSPASMLYNIIVPMLFSSAYALALLSRLPRHLGRVIEVNTWYTGSVCVFVQYTQKNCNLI